MSELTDRMRTTAAYLTGTVLAQLDDHRIVGTPEQHARAVQDAAAQLIEAAGLIEEAIKRPAEPEMLGPPMEILKPYPFTVSMPAPPAVEVGQRADLPRDDAWVAPGGPLPGVKDSGTRAKRSCPQCGSFAYKRVFRRERQMYLHCGVCRHEWKFELARHA